jgi:hypothetical protein
MATPVIPAKANQRRSLAGIQEKQVLLDPGFRRGDGSDDFLRGHQNKLSSNLRLPSPFPFQPPALVYRDKYADRLATSQDLGSFATTG